jgi:hypothetical protein
MTITLDPKLEAALKEAAERRGFDPERLALRVLQIRFLNPPDLQPRDEWERELMESAWDYGVSLPDSAYDRGTMYE